MRFDFSDLPIGNRAFSDAPMTFCPPAAIGALAGMLELTAVETGNRRAREHWQKVQVRNVLQHARQRSAFWRRRIGEAEATNGRLSALPVLDRRAVNEQVGAEGALLTGRDPIAVQAHATSGSSGTPVRFFISAMNVRYNLLRSLAQYLMEGRDLSLNRTRLTSQPVSAPHGFTVEVSDNWLGDLAPLMRCGINKHIPCFHPEPQRLRRELEQHPIGYLVTSPRLLELLLSHLEPGVLKRAGAAMIVTLAEPVDPSLRATFAELGIPIRATYSCEEVGPIGMECPQNPGRYHVATSNVAVEVTQRDGVQVGDRRLGRVLLTHLHGYATPFIRYDVGDLAVLSDRCPCGHDGPTLSDVQGRTKGLLRDRDGSLRAFYLRAADLIAVAPHDEFRIRQTSVDTVVAEIGRPFALTAPEVDGIRTLLARHVGTGISVDVRWVPAIDWGEDRKRLGFRSDVL